MLTGIVAALTALDRASAAAQQTATVSGVVLDGTTNAPVVGSVVVLPALSRSATTDGTGAFTLRGIPEGTHEWTIAALGYVPLHQESETRDGDYFRAGLLPWPIMLEEVVVDARRVDRILEHRRRAAGVSVQSIRRAEILGSAVASAQQFVEERAGMVLCPAPLTSDGIQAARATALADQAAGLKACVHRRGRIVPVSVYVNDQRAFGGCWSSPPSTPGRSTP